MDRYQKFINEKAKKKRELLGKMFFPRTPVLLINCADSGTDDYGALFEGLKSIDLTTIVVAPHPAAQRDKNIFYFTPDKLEDAAAAADFVVAPDNGNLKTWRAEGCVPISQLDGDSTVNYNPLQEKGNGFYFKNPTAWEMFAAVVRALETYQFPYDWENLVREMLKEEK